MYNNNKKLIILFLLFVLLFNSGCIQQEQIQQEIETYILKAKITVDRNIAYTNETITFSGLESKGNITHYSWNFSDGIKEDASGEIVSYTYSLPGIYRVRLKVTDVYGNYSHDSIYVYINWKKIIENYITVNEKHHINFPVDKFVNKCILLLEYTPEYRLGMQTQNLDLSVLVKYDETYMYVSSSNNTKDGGKEEIKVSRGDILFYYGFGDWSAEVYFNETLREKKVNYRLSIEVRYD